jgi:hypothetical protein
MLTPPLPCKNGSNGLYVGDANIDEDGGDVGVENDVDDDVVDILIDEAVSSLSLLHSSLLTLISSLLIITPSSFYPHSSQFILHSVPPFPPPLLPLTILTF